MRNDRDFKKNTERKFFESPSTLPKLFALSYFRAMLIENQFGVNYLYLK